MKYDDPLDCRQIDDIKIYVMENDAEYDSRYFDKQALINRLRKLKWRTTSEKGPPPLGLPWRMVAYSGGKELFRVDIYNYTGEIFYNPQDGRILQCDFWIPFQKELLKNGCPMVDPMYGTLSDTGEFPTQ